MPLELSNVRPDSTYFEVELPRAELDKKLRTYKHHFADDYDGDPQKKNVIYFYTKDNPEWMTPLKRFARPFNALLRIKESPLQEWYLLSIANVEETKTAHIPEDEAVYIKTKYALILTTYPTQAVLGGGGAPHHSGLIVCPHCETPHILMYYHISEVLYCEPCKTSFRVGLGEDKQTAVGMTDVDYALNWETHGTKIWKVYEDMKERQKQREAEDDASPDVPL